MPEEIQPVLTVQPHPDAILATVVSPQLSHEASLQLRSSLDDVLAGASSAPLILEMSQVEFVPSLALGILVNVHKALRQAGRRCLLVGLQPLVLEAMQATALDRFFEIHSTLEEGLNRLK